MPAAVSELYVYPIKSCRGVKLSSAAVEERGFQWDRHWMLVDEQGTFLSQRVLPGMARLEVRIAQRHLSVDGPGMDSLEVPLEPEPRSAVRTTIWNDAVRAEPYGEDINRWFSECLGVSCRLVKFPQQHLRRVDRRYAKGSEHVAFTDGYPFLLLSEASLGDLNSRLRRPIPVNRFRPNIVVTGCEAFAEDSWREFRIASVTFTAVKPCARCRVITVDQTTGVIDEEPLHALSLFRSRGSKVVFGQNLLHAGSGRLAVGDAVHILTQGPIHGN